MSMPYTLDTALNWCTSRVNNDLIDLPSIYVYALCIFQGYAKLLD